MVGFRAGQHNWAGGGGIVLVGELQSEKRRGGEAGPLIHISLWHMWPWGLPVTSRAESQRTCLALGFSAVGEGEILISFCFN